MNQFFLLVFSLLAIFLTQQTFDLSLAKYAPIIGLISQPFWIYSSLKAKQWGILVSSVAYTFVWCLGIYNNYTGGLYAF